MKIEMHMHVLELRVAVSQSAAMMTMMAHSA
jgi:hypothetical protein